MIAVKFEAEVQNGMIKIPKEYANLESMQIEVVAKVLDENKKGAHSSISEPDNRELISDDYLMKNWRDLVAEGLSKYNEAYYQSDQYADDRGQYLAEKYR